MKYKSRAQSQFEEQELAIAAEFNEIKDIQELTRLKRENKMKEFFQLANRVLRIKRNHPVVSKVQKLNGNGEVEVIDDKNLAEQAIAEYFTQIYRRPEHMALLPSDIIDEEMTDEDEVPLGKNVPNEA